MLLVSRRSIECDDAEFDALAQAILEEGLILRFRAKGVSMHPFVRSGDLLYVQTIAPDRVHIGDLVLFRIAGSKVAVHRVLRRKRLGEKSAFVIKGDRVEQPDGVVPAENILGQVIARERDGVKIDLTTPARRLVKAGIAWLSPVWPVLLPIVGRLRSLIFKGRNRTGV